MQNNLRNRSVALASTFALALTGIVATAPAASAQTPVVLKPTVGTNTGALITDTFEMSIEVPSNLDPKDLAIKITNPESEELGFTIANAGIGTDTGFTLRAFSATGTPINVSTSRSNLSGAEESFDTVRKVNIVTGETGRTDIEFDDTSDDTQDIKSLVITDIQDAGAVLADRTIVLGLTLLDGSGSTFSYGDGNQGDITVQAWVETDPDPSPSDFLNADDTTASSSATVKWYDPKGISVIPSIERFVNGSGDLETNDDGDNGLAGKIRFVRPDLNLDQLDLEDWNVEMISSPDVEVNISGNTARADLAGTNSSLDAAGALYFSDDFSSTGLQSSSLYTVRVYHEGTSARQFNSAGYSIPTGGEARSIFASVTDAEGVEQTTSKAPEPGTPGTNENNVTLRPGTASFTHKARLFTSDSSTREKEASQLIVATVEAGDFMPAGTELTVSGSSDTLSSSGAATVVSGLTDSDGDFSVTVTSSNPVALTGYTVKFYKLAADNLLLNTNADDSVSGDSTITATYAATTVSGSSSLTLDSDVAAGETVTIGASATDNFGEAVSLSGTKQLYVTAQGTSTTDLDETVAVAADGSASISFSNYVASGESDVVTVYLHTGATFVSGDQITSKIVSVYNPDSVAAVNVPATKSGNITYDDFITGKASSTNVAPNDGEMDITGTVVDSNGAGVPGAVVTVDADEMQLRQKDTGNYFQDSITFTADAAGRFTVTLWAHTVNPTGVDVTISSGGQSATTTVKTYLPDALSVNGGNLVFTMDVPANIDLNKTYAIQASLTDKWGNPIKTSGDAVDIQGFGSVNINSKDDGPTIKDFGSDGKVTVFLRSIKDIEGPGSVQASLKTGAVYATGATSTNALSRTEVTTDVAGTAFDETSFSNEIEVDVNVGEAAQSSTQKVNAGSFKGFVALYAKGYEGQRMSAIVAGKWLQVDSLASNFERVVRFTGAGYDIKVRIYIDGEQVGPEFDILTK